MILPLYTSGDNIPYTSQSEADVYLKEVSYTNLTGFVLKSSATVVYSGTLDFVSDGNGGGTVTITFATPYNYNGGNLLVGIENTTDAGFGGISFYGQTVSGASWAGSSSTSLGNVTGVQCNFIPKTTFTYTGAEVNSTADWYGFIQVSGDTIALPHRKFYKFNMQSMQAQPVSLTSNVYYWGAEYLDGKVYLCSQDGIFYSASFTGSSPMMDTAVELGPVGGDGRPYNEMSYSTVDQTMYAIGGLGQTLVSVNLSDGSHTVINGSLDVPNNQLIVAFAINAAGQAYCIATDGNLYRINLSTGALTLVGSTGLEERSSIQTMSFDRTTGELFCCWVDEHSSGVYLVNTTTGHATLVRTVGDVRAQMTGLFMVYDFTPNGIGDVEDDGIKIYARDGRIEIEGADGETVMFYDAMGREISEKLKVESGKISHVVPASGVYLVKVGNHPARKVVVVR